MKTVKQTGHSFSKRNRTKSSSRVLVSITPHSLSHRGPSTYSKERRERFEKKRTGAFEGTHDAN